ncbi:noncanonical pyrimidine nucleotidase, YjjG family [Apibacter muscae]|uniref:Noncanonical pyrimidine nucleotidase, YjjG family n=1 Tax=Apibacter muscae TaxID=2509004 RepID=A0A563DLC9_9FLAO|nr:YjjG family noncanonical pyrimidine nucleotidase [Apibacter muscae]TWP30614.1 noncanonical pyrimidine nucleotidase, YjjG family [Apibacter muscae]TWP31450.1 noncanonical pyrimidine nucleotidase, YjjG family [Apibacter muscae]
MLKEIKHLFFDLDNTLWDTDRNSKLTLQKMYHEKNIEEKYSLNFSDFYRNYYHRNENLWALYRENKITKQNILDRRFTLTFKEYGIEDRDIQDYFNENFLKKMTENNYLIDGAEETLKYLKEKNYSLHIVSNGFKEQTYRKVNDTAIKNFVSTITSGEEINKRKPAPEVFHLGLSKANAKAEESVFIGDDWESDIIGSSKIGMQAIYFDYNHKNENLNKGFQVIQKLNELISIL